MSSKKKVLRFVVTGALLSAPMVTGCGSEPDMVNEPAPQPTVNEPVEETMNEVVEPEPIEEDPINEPPEEAEPPPDDSEEAADEPTNIPAE